MRSRRASQSCGVSTVPPLNGSTSASPPAAATPTTQCPGSPPPCTSTPPRRLIEAPAVEAGDRGLRGGAEAAAHGVRHGIEPLQIEIDLELRILVAGHQEGGPREVHLVLGAGDHVDELAPVRLRHNEDLRDGGVIPVLDRAARLGHNACMSPLPGSTRAWPVLILAGAAALAAACNGHPAAPIIPAGDGGTLKAEISASATSGRAPLEITFTSNVHGGDGAYRYQWSFGDGRTSSAANPRVQFLSGGSFDVQLQVSSGDQTVTAGPLTVRLDSHVRPSCVADPAEAIAPAAVSFLADPSGGTGTVTYRPGFGAGT